jgi:N-ethylmaleimide reductase
MSAMRWPKSNVLSTDTPRALETTEIARAIEDFRCGGGLAIEAGFDGVEIHGGNPEQSS